MAGQCGLCGAIQSSLAHVCLKTLSPTHPGGPSDGIFPCRF
jgi:hypothetical protein